MPFHIAIGLCALPYLDHSGNLPILAANSGDFTLTQHFYFAGKSYVDKLWKIAQCYSRKACEAYRNICFCLLIFGLDFCIFFGSDVGLHGLWTCQLFFEGHQVEASERIFRRIWTSLDFPIGFGDSNNFLFADIVRCIQVFLEFNCCFVSKVNHINLEYLFCKFAILPHNYWQILALFGRLVCLD